MWVTCSILCNFLFPVSIITKPLPLIFQEKELWCGVLISKSVDWRLNKFSYFNRDNIERITKEEPRTTVPETKIVTHVRIWTENTLTWKSTGYKLVTTMWPITIVKISTYQPKEVLKNTIIFYLIAQWRFYGKVIYIQCLISKLLGVGLLIYLYKPHSLFYNKAYS